MAWQLQDAKNRFSEVVDAALASGPQLVTRRGEPTVMIVAIDEWNKLSTPKPSIRDYLRASPFDDDLDVTGDGEIDPMILLDTSVISELRKTRPDAAVSAWLDAQREHDLYLSAITLGELRSGIDLLPSRRRDQLGAWLHGLIAAFDGRILGLDADVALAWGRVSAACIRAGAPIPPIDGLIAAMALHHGATLATRNVAAFEGTGVRVVDPWSP